MSAVRAISGPLRHDGLTAAEGAVMHDLIAASAAYGALVVEDDSEPPDFAGAIHDARRMLTVRAERRGACPRQR